MATWQKVLYEEQPFEDNYVPPTFLEQLRTNEHVQEHNYWGMVASTAAITLQTSSVLIFYAVFEYSNENLLSVISLGSINVGVAILGYCIYRFALGISFGKSQVLSSCLLFLATLSILSPVLRTLTESYADDTIWALTYSLSLLHLISHDYCYVPSESGHVFGGTVSLNAAIFTAVLLASRLASNDQVFAFMLFAIELFALLPMFQRELKRESEGAHVVTVVIMFTLSICLSYHATPALCAVHSVFTPFVTFVCPLWFMHVQEHKTEILGPWDIAHIQPQQ